MIYVYAIIAIAMGLFLALKGLSQYRILLSLSVTISNGTFSLYVSNLSPDYLSPTSAIIIALVSGVLTYIFAKSITYIWLYVFQWYLLLAIFIIVGLTPESMGGTIFAVLFLMPILGTFLLRHHVKPLVIGMLSGFTIGAGIAMIVTTQLIENYMFMEVLKVPAIILLLFIIVGIIFQYAYILKRNPQLAKI